MNKYRYAQEKLSDVIKILSTGEGDVRSRLLIAHLEMSPLRDIDFPESVVDNYHWIKFELTRREPRYPSEIRE